METQKPNLLIDYVLKEAKEMTYFRTPSNERFLKKR